MNLRFVCCRGKAPSLPMGRVRALPLQFKIKFIFFYDLKLIVIFFQLMDILYITKEVFYGIK